MAQVTHIHVRRRRHQNGIIGGLRRHLQHGWQLFASYADGFVHPAGSAS